MHSSRLTLPLKTTRTVLTSNRFLQTCNPCRAGIGNDYTQITTCAFLLMLVVTLSVQLCGGNAIDYVPCGSSAPSYFDPPFS